MSLIFENKSVAGVVWSAIERFSVQGIQFILGIVIARLINPSDYGLIAMLGIFLAIAQTFTDSGFSQALIQKKNRNETDFSTVFFFNFGISVVIFLLFCLGASGIASFYNEPKLELITRWVALNIILTALSIVQRTELTIKMDFKTQAKASLVSVVLSGILGVTLAWLGFGVWALIWQTLCNSLLNTILLWILSTWKPRLLFSWCSFKELFSFGSKLLASGLLHTIYTNMYSLVIGKKYTPAEVGFFNRASTLSQFPSTNLVMIITRVSYPTHCELQNEPEKLRKSFIQYIRLSSFFIFPLMVALAALAEPLVHVLLTDKWKEVVPLLQILCLANMWLPVMYLNNNMLAVKGRTDFFLRAEIIKKVTGILIMLATLPLGVKILCMGLVLYSIADMGLTIYYTRKVIDCGYMVQLKNVLPIALTAFLMGIVMISVTKIFNGYWIQLLAGSFSGLFTYLLLVYVFRFDETVYLKSVLNKLRKYV